MEQSTVNIPKDLRGTKKVGRQSNEERATVPAIKEAIRKSCADILFSIRKEDIKNMSTNEKITYLARMLPFIMEDDNQSVESVTIGMLIKKAISVDEQIQKANSATKSKTPPAK